MSTFGLDLAHLSLVEALDLAILVEEEAQDRYEEFADQMDLHRTPEAARFFRFMAENEGKHGRALINRRTRLFGSAPQSFSRSVIIDVEAPEYDEARAFMSPRQAMQAALKSEQKARIFFADALPGIQDSDVKALFQELRDEEVEHEDLVRAEMAKLPPDLAFMDEDFVDPPAAQ